MSRKIKILCVFIIFSAVNAFSQNTFKAYFNANVGGSCGNYLGIILPELGLQAGFGINPIHFLFDSSFGACYDAFEKINYLAGIIYNLGGIMEFYFAGICALGIGGGFGNIKSGEEPNYFFPYLRGAMSMVLHKGQIKIGLYYDYNFYYGFKIGFKYHFDPTVFLRERSIFSVFFR